MNFLQNLKSTSVTEFVMSHNVFIRYDQLCRLGVKMRTRKRMVTMFQFGATTGPSRTPLFMNKVIGLNSMLPCPVVKSSPGSKYFDEFIKIPWMQDLELLMLVNSL